MSETIIRIPGKLVADEYGTKLANFSDLDNNVYGPYVSVAAAHAALSANGLNTVGTTVGISGSNNTVVEYWYQGGTAQANLVEKETGITTEQMNAAIKHGVVTGTSISATTTTDDRKTADAYVAGDIFTFYDSQSDTTYYYVALESGNAGDSVVNPTKFFATTSSTQAVYQSMKVKNVSATEQQSLPTTEKQTARTNIAAVGYEAQTLTAQQKEQAAQNIGLDAVVKGDVQQSLSDAQKVQAQNNMMGKAYIPAQNSGLGKVYLGKNNGVLTQSMMNTANTVFVIQYDYTLGGNITIPANCVLEFDGGSISASGNNDTITGNGTGIHAGFDRIFGDDITLAGTWNVSEVYPEWFGAVGNGTHDDTLAIQSAINISSEYSLVYFSPKTYVVSDVVTIPHNNITLTGRATLFAMADSPFEYIIYANNRTGITIDGLTLDVNGGNRTNSQTVHHCGITLIGHGNNIRNVTVRNTRGTSEIPAVCISVVGNNNIINNCRCEDGGIPGYASDAVYVGGQNNIVSNSISRNCTDTGFVLENCKKSMIFGCISEGCSAGAAITCFAPYTYGGNSINGLVIRNWKAINTGGIAVGTVGSDSADCKLINTSISNVVLEADVTNGYGVGSAIFVRGLGQARVKDISILNCKIDGATKYGIEIASTVENAFISNCTIQNSAERGIYTGGILSYISSCRIKGGIISIATGGDTVIKNCLISDFTSWGIYNYGGSMIATMNDILPGGIGAIGKADGATINHISQVGTGISSLNVEDTAPAGSAAKRYPVWDASGTTIIGYIPIYS